MTLRSGVATHVGSVRVGNEDRAFAGRSVFAVADGMGGHAAGEVASAIAVENLGRVDGLGPLRPDDIRAELVTANDEILARAETDPDLAGMGTTVTGIGLVRVAGSEHWVVFNIGDSRVYRFAEDGLSRLTIDHSEVEELVLAGEITVAESRVHPRRNVVTRALGIGAAPEPDQWVFPPIAGERFVLCSDGLTVELDDAEIADVLRGHADPQSAADELVRRAVEAGGRDNVTVVVVDHLVAEAEPGDTAPRRA